MATDWGEHNHFVLRSIRGWLIWIAAILALILVVLSVFVCTGSPWPVRVTSMPDSR